MLANRFVPAEAHQLHYLHILLAKEIERRKSQVISGRKEKRTWFWPSSPRFAFKRDEIMLTTDMTKAMAVCYQEHKVLEQTTRKPTWGAVWKHNTSSTEGSRMERYVNSILPHRLKLFTIKLRANLLWTRHKKWSHKAEILKTRRKEIDRPFDPTCPLCEGTAETGPAMDTWEHAIAQCPHQTEERLRLLQGIREKHSEVIRARNIQNLLTKDWLQGKLGEIPAIQRDAVARLQIDIWQMAKELWCQSRQAIRKIEKKEETQRKMQERRDKEKRRREEIERNRPGQKEKQRKTEYIRKRLKEAAEKRKQRLTNKSQEKAKQKSSGPPRPRDRATQEKETGYEKPRLDLKHKPEHNRRTRAFTQHLPKDASDSETNPTKAP